MPNNPTSNTQHPTPILVTGSNGQLGSEIKALIQHAPTGNALGVPTSLALNADTPVSKEQEGYNIQHHNFISPIEVP